jgi:hypothetical protein
MTLVVVTPIVFHAPVWGALMLPCVRRVPGCPALSLYRPKNNTDDAELASTKTVMDPIEPVSAAVVWKASA